MKNVDAAVKTAIRTAHDIKALPRLTAEWNMNRYSIPTVTNAIGVDWVTKENDVDHFPIDSIVEPIRPSKGINKARINMSTISDGYNSPNQPRYYVAGLEDKYKYWVSPYASDSGGNIGNCTPTVIYDRQVKTNKIVVTIENSWASPVTWSIQTTIDAGASWQVASSAPVIGADGRAILYWGTGSWSSTKPTTPGTPTTINGLRLVVTRLGGGRGIDNQPTVARTWAGIATTNGANSLFSLIEMSPRYEMDLTASLAGVSDTFDAGEVNQITPVGTITSNVGSFTIWNGDNTFASTMAGLLEPNVKINVEHIYHVGTTQYPVQQASMYTESWDETDDSLINVSMSDASKYLKETYPMEAKYENLTLAQIVYRLCDSVGFTDYNIINYGNINDYRIPVFWADGTQTIWELFNELAMATQSLIYFDAWGRLNVKSRENAYNPARPVDWTLRAVKSGNDLPDIETLEKSNEFDSNVIKVKYKKVSWAEEVNGHVSNTTVWSPEETVTLRSTPLIEGLPPGKTHFTITPAEATHWPYEGHVQIEGEFIEYSGKWFNYREGGVWKSVWVHDQKEYDTYNEKGGSVERQYNNFAGHMKIKERGVWNSAEVDHTPEAKEWTVRRWDHGSGSFRYNRACWQWFRGSSLVRMASNGELTNLNQWAIATRDTGADNTYRHFGTRFRFNGAGLHQRGGIIINSNPANGDGYYVELRPTNTIENRNRDTEDEIIIYAIHNGNIKQMKSNAKPHDLIVADRWHDLAVYYEAGGHRLSIWLDGKMIMTDNILPSNYRHAPTGKFGMFIRGQTNLDFEYFYALHQDEPEMSDDVSFLNRTTGAYAGDVWMRDMVYRQGTRSRWVKRKGKKKKLIKNEKYKYAQFMDEFGPYVHEVREFDVKFDPSPVKSAFLYFSNDWQIICPEFRSGSHGAYFILANASRTNAVVQGDDDLSFAAAGVTVPQQLLVYGRNLVIGEDEEVEVRNEEQIRARGEIIAEIDSPWVQDEAAAQAVADWIAAHWAKGSDQLDVQVFGNTLFEVGDLVAIDFPKKGYNTNTHQYFVTGIDTEFDAGIVTKLTLQRKN